MVRCAIICSGGGLALAVSLKAIMVQMFAI
ncbi:exported hypothetical protein [Candidatus Accumulibacter aalborgensis]|uniref:Uncharacterized protein n=1 Tax=Candidatus Accumulibacter aalborgensis TaxID=1860102 RepID=A0A1A8XH24_9PROT|nr:exported hypothetical protein [Candidatus Accumulibacter aalborgensis]